MATLSGQVTVSNAGQPVAGPAAPGGDYFALKAHPDNTGPVWVGNDGAGGVSSATGYPLGPGESLLVAVRSLAALRFDAAVSGDSICWLRVLG